MNMLPLLRDLDHLSAYVLYIALFGLSLSAYKQTKQRGFVFWGFAALGYILNVPLPFQSNGFAGHRDLSKYLVATHFTGFVSNILMAIGLVIIVKDYIALCRERIPKPPADNGQAS